MLYYVFQKTDFLFFPMANKWAHEKLRMELINRIPIFFRPCKITPPLPPQKFQSWNLESDDLYISSPNSITSWLHAAPTTPKDQPLQHRTSHKQGYIRQLGRAHPTQYRPIIQGSLWCDLPDLNNNMDSKRRSIIARTWQTQSKYQSTLPSLPQIFVGKKRRERGWGSFKKWIYVHVPGFAVGFFVPLKCHARWGGKSRDTARRSTIFRVRHPS